MKTGHSLRALGAGSARQELASRAARRALNCRFSIAPESFSDVGKGVIDWKGIFAANPGIEHYFVEHDHPADPFASSAAGYTYLKGLTVAG